ncbi:3-methyl-2-oxobutanoate hydroxymethyltransferase [Ideonella dechloratans]|uniref:3-methyl-2-oxobutanoate hydroxymethyltransferase n=1 Tax=Ideonella dechloratans TaxID=36863 RepID=A0A643FGL4_IDEDE|nr:3-methyl-2-oxobutanoate hydroxymethyltransferase [Ideonella dechloratans]KAB0583622.1 3-methyl-2-oxobutanoate hydroxymethyltransferase [Ideonella dechloratans]UFU11137.1 3-methyl-2-oxobutanoate hydroxymethyltransferase [Ideonella dechloratans]
MSVHPVEPSAAAPRPALNLPRLRDMAARGEKLAMVTCYDATFAQLLDAAEVDIQLVGDSLGNVVQGQSSTLPVTLEHMAYHTACVARAKRQAWLVTDMPFGSYEASPQQAFESAAALMRAGAQMVKIEGGGDIAHTVRFLVDRGIPVCGHLGLTPQRVHALGGFRIQGRDEAAAAQLKADAAALAQAGAAMLVLELVPSALAREITQAHPEMMTIGIGAGAGTTGQVLVLHDLLGLTSGKRPRFVRDFTREPGSAADAPGLSVAQALRRYVVDVKAGRFPDEAVHGY